jgi:adenosylcobinamide-phosphate synthase
MEAIYILIGALVIDLMLGEPPLTLHPVVWMGKFTGLWDKSVLKLKPWVQMVYGTIMTLFTIGLFTVPTYFLMFYLKGWNDLVYIVVGMVLFKTIFSLKELLKAAKSIKVFLLEKNLVQARFGLRSLVKRETKNLSEQLVVSATVESVTENICDSFVAPLFYFLVLGIPGAVAYRVINTLDAMIGLHGKYEFLGKFAARLDDVVNIIPARLTGLLLIIAALLSRKNSKAAWNIMVRDHARTASPNAGWPMSAAAGALGVQLSKLEHYQLGDDRCPLVPQTIDHSMQLALYSAMVWFGVCFAVEVARFAIVA